MDEYDPFSYEDYESIPAPQHGSAKRKLSLDQLESLHRLQTPLQREYPGIPGSSEPGKHLLTLPSTNCHDGDGATADQAPCVTSHNVVFVWDLDETLVIFNSLLNGQFAVRLGPEGE